MRQPATARRSTADRCELEASFFLIFPTIKLMFKRSDLSSYFFSSTFMSAVSSSLRQIIFWKSNAVREKDLIFCNGRSYVIAFRKR